LFFYYKFKGQTGNFKIGDGIAITTIFCLVIAGIAGIVSIRFARAVRWSRTFRCTCAIYMGLTCSLNLNHSLRMSNPPSLDLFTGPEPFAVPEPADAPKQSTAHDQSTVPEPSTRQPCSVGKKRKQNYILKRIDLNY
jgi:hypothetical protein